MKSDKLGSKVCVSIDFGMAYARVCVFKDDRVETIVNEQGNSKTPAYVAFTESRHLVGEMAKKQAISNPLNTVFHSSRLVGQPLQADSVLKAMKQWPFKICS